MATPTRTITNAPLAISATAEANGLLLSVNQNIPDAVLRLVLSGTYTTATVLVRGRLAGMYESSDPTVGVYAPISGVDQVSNAAVGTAGTFVLTNSSTNTWQFSVQAYDWIEVYASAIATGAIVVEKAITPPSTQTPPVLNATVSGVSGTTGSFSTSLSLPDNSTLIFGTGDDILVDWNGTDLAVTQAAADSQVLWGVSGAGINHVFYGDTATYNMTWDQSNNQLLFNDNAALAIGTGAGAAGDITFLWNATKLLVAQLTTNSAVDWGVDGAGLDQNWYGDTASAVLQWDQSADTLIFAGVAKVSGVRVVTAGATAITTTRAVTKADSGGIFTTAQSSAYTVTVAQPAGAGERYVFQLVAPGAFDISLVATGCTFEGTITIDAATIPATGSTLKFVSGAAILGDNIELISTSTTKFLVRAIGSGAGGITIT